MKNITSQDELLHLCRELSLIAKEQSAQIAALTAMCRALCMTHPNRDQALAVYRQAQKGWDKPGKEDLLVFWTQLEP